MALSRSGFERLDHLEALEIGVAEIERAVGAGVAVGEAKRLRLRPAFGIGAAAPQGMRRIEHVVVALGPAQQVEGDKARNAAELRRRASSRSVRTPPVLRERP